MPTVFLEISTAETMSEMSLLTNTTLHASIAKSVPDPTAMPTSDAVSAGASFIPSPTISAGPIFLSSEMASTLADGNTCAYTLSMPTLWATSFAVPVLSR